MFLSIVHVPDEQKHQNSGKIRDVTLKSAVSERYLSYALSTITARSLPSVCDGLKPVHRRILFAMHESGNFHSRPHRKSANAVGYVMMHFHPHGDSAIYDSLVRMTQNFVMGAPLIEGQGNFGSIDGDNAAAMRYTECRLTPLAEALMVGLNEDAVDFVSNYNGQKKEPRVLPSRVPNLLLNGAMGIAVGMATNIPPHNLQEVCNALRHLIKHPETPCKTLMKYVVGPDFPTGGVIVESPESLAETYATGRGSIRVRAKWAVEPLKNGQYAIVVSEIPFGVMKSRLIEKTAEALLNKKLPLLGNIADESAADIRIILTPKTRTTDPDVLMESLFKLTELETRFSVNINVLNEKGTPGVMSLKGVMQAFLAHRYHVFIRRTHHRCAKIAERLEVLDGLLVVYLNLDEVIGIIRTEDEPADVLKTRFVLTDLQVEAILNTRLRGLRKLEEIKLTTEQNLLRAEQKNLQEILGDTHLQWRAIDEDLADLSKQFGTPRRSMLAKAPSDIIIDADAFIEKEPVTILFSDHGWIRTHKGHGVDVKDLRFREGDSLAYFLEAQTTEKLIIMVSDGKFYTIGVDKLPGGRGFGEPLRVQLDLSAEIQIVHMFIAAHPDKNAKRLLVATDGRGFSVCEKDLLAQTRQGKQVMKIPKGVRALKSLPHTGDTVAICGSNRKILFFLLSEVPLLQRGRGVILQKYTSPETTVTDVTLINAHEGLTWKGRSAERPFNIGLWMGKRACVGRTTPTGFPRSGKFDES
ncbi:MAG: DNA topoisomerase IV subunit A [Alphaproteobacteria bacterium]|nr:MAG: DNA topoisomerase IV subunit A [Alphaproteobacteria bacterium]